MPASKKGLKKQEQKKNREAGVGDAQGRLPSRVKVTNFKDFACRRWRRTQIVEYREVETRMRNMTEEEMMIKSTRRVHRHHNSLPVQKK